MASTCLIFLSLLLSLRSEYLFWETSNIFINLILFQEANKPPDSWFELKINTHVYVTGLPEDVTVDEVSINFCLALPESLIFLAKTNLGIIVGCGNIFQVWNYKRGTFLFLYSLLICKTKIYGIYLFSVFRITLKVSVIFN